MKIDDMINKEDYIKQEQGKRTGRPKKAVKADNKVSTYLNDYELATLHESAENMGLNVSQYLKLLIKKQEEKQ